MIDHGLTGIEASLSSSIAKQLNIRTTPTTVLYRGTSIVYRGKLSERDDPARPGTHYPAAAIVALTKQKPYIRSTSVTGCPIRQATIQSIENNAADTEVALEPSPITWNGNVKTIFSRSCLPCHTGTGVGPVKLVNYSDIYGMATKIQGLVSSRTMPPWQAEDIGKFHDDPSLSLSELQQLDLWFKRGMPVGGKIATAQQPIEIASNKWQLGQPTLVINQSEVCTPCKRVYRYQWRGKKNGRCRSGSWLYQPVTG
jgi:hypothetical protein